MIPLPNSEDVNKDNVVEVVKQTLKALQEVSDSTGTTGLSLYNEMRALRGDINSLEKKVDQGFENLRAEFKQEIGEVKEVLNEIKNDFISEQKETNQLLKKLIEK